DLRADVDRFFRLDGSGGGDGGDDVAALNGRGAERGDVFVAAVLEPHPGRADQHDRDRQHQQVSDPMLHGCSESSESWASSSLVCCPFSPASICSRPASTPSSRCSSIRSPTLSSPNTSSCWSGS